MSEEKKPTSIGEMIGKMASGVEKIKAGNKKPKIDPESEIIVGEPVDENDPDSLAAVPRSERREPSLDDDDFIIGQAETVPATRPSVKGTLAKLSMKQKAIAAGVVLVAVFALKNHFAGSPSSIERQPEIVDAPFIEEDLELPSTSLSAQPVESLPGFDVDDHLFAGAATVEAGIEPAHESEAAFRSFSDDLTLAPDNSDQMSESPFTAAPLPASTNDVPTSAPARNGFVNTASFDTTFGGSVDANPDSSKGVLESGLNEELAEARKALLAKEASFTDLEKQLQDVTARLKLEQSKQSKPAAAAPKAKAPTPVAKAPARQSPVATSPAPRPSLCVSAVAQAARNCSTCVAHAFLTHKGQETMLGHGDFIEGYRVSISGDRLDLQTTNGDVVHKYWSSPDGCSRT